MTTWLYAYDGGRPFAWTSDGRDYWLVGDSTWWARRDGKWLYSQRGQIVGYFDGQTVYDSDTHRPVHFGD